MPEPIKQKISPSVPTTVIQKPILEVRDAYEADKKIPRDLIIMYQGKPYITKAGLEWKADYLYGRGKYSLGIELIERTPDYVLAKSTLILANGRSFNNFGEASKLNTAPMMQKQLLHLAVTRSECRVLRMVTACGYMSYEEMDFTSVGEKEIPVSEKDGEPLTEAQRSVILKIAGNLLKLEDIKSYTQKQAKEKIVELLNENKKNL